MLISLVFMFMFIIIIIYLRLIYSTCLVATFHDTVHMVSIFTALLKSAEVDGYNLLIVKYTFFQWFTGFIILSTEFASVLSID